MKALITGASSGFGWDMAHILSDMGYDIIAVARRGELLEKLKGELKTNVEAIVCDVTDREFQEALSAMLRLKRVSAPLFVTAESGLNDNLINNAGFGVFGAFDATSLDEELSMIDTNVKAMHTLMKLFLPAFKKRNSGYIMNVASLAAFFPGPLFASYYATKAYVLRLTQAVAEELRRDGSKVKICALCPGPAHTGFASAAKVNFGTGKEGGIAGKVVLTSLEVSKYAIKQMFKGKEVIVPGPIMRLGVFARHFVSDKLLAKAVYTVQSKKMVIK